MRIKYYEIKKAFAAGLDVYFTPGNPKGLHSRDYFKVYDLPQVEDLVNQGGTFWAVPWDTWTGTFTVKTLPV